MVELRDDLRLAVDRVAFARSVRVEPDPWQEDLLHSESPRLLLNCSRQSGKSTMAAILALHRALYHPASLVLVLAPALRQSQELFTKIAGFYASLESPRSTTGPEAALPGARKRKPHRHAAGQREDHQGVLGGLAVDRGRGSPR